MSEEEKEVIVYPTEAGQRIVELTNRVEFLESELKSSEILRSHTEQAHTHEVHRRRNAEATLKRIYDMCLKADRESEGLSTLLTSRVRELVQPYRGKT